jgi:hypothetical protein
MPSMAHDVLVDLFKNRPSLGAELLTEVLGVPVPPYTDARVTSIDLTQIRPAEYRADVVVLLLDQGVPMGVLIVEVQLGIDHDKRFTWPEYTTGARAKHRCPVTLLVVAPDPEIAAWCAEPIEIGVPGFVMVPPVLGREAVPIITRPRRHDGPSSRCCPRWRTATASMTRRSRRQCCRPWPGSGTSGPDSTAISCYIPSTRPPGGPWRRR